MTIAMATRGPTESLSVAKETVSRFGHTSPTRTALCGCVSVTHCEFKPGPHPTLSRALTPWCLINAAKIFWSSYASFNGGRGLSVLSVCRPLCALPEVNRQPLFPADEALRLDPVTFPCARNSLRV